MKILIFLKKWKGGVGVVTNSIKKELESKGHEVISISREEDLKSFSSIKNLFWLRKKYKQIIKKENPDIIYTQDWSMALPLLFPFKIFNKKHFTCFHGNQLGKTKFIQKIIGKIMGRNLIVVGDSLKKNFPKATLVYNGVDLDLFKPNNKIKKIKNSVGFVNWKTDNYHYNEIKNACKNSNKKLLVAESIPYEKMPEFYQRLECFISLPPKGAGFNISWIEAMACGVPKIIGNNEGIGKKLNIDKVKKRKLIEGIKMAKKRNYRKEIEKMNLTWKSHTSKLLEVWKNEK